MPAWEDEKAQRQQEVRQQRADRLLIAIVALSIADLTFLLLAKFAFDFVSWATAETIAVFTMGVLALGYGGYFLYSPLDNPRWMKWSFSLIAAAIASVMFATVAF